MTAAGAPSGAGWGGALVLAVAVAVTWSVVGGVLPAAVGGGLSLGPGTAPGADSALGPIVGVQGTTLPVELEPTAGSAGAGLTGRVTAALTPDASTLVAGSPIPGSPKIDPGQWVILQGNASGGTPPYSYQWYSGTYPQCAGDNQTVGTTPKLNVSAALGSLYYCYTVTDNATPPDLASLASADLVTVDLSLAALPPTPASATIDLGTSVTFTANVEGGSPPYTVDWYASAPGSPSCTVYAVGTGLTFAAKPSTNTSYCYTATDASVGSPAVSVGSTPATVYVDPAVQAAAVTPAAPTIDSGQSVVLTAAPSGGTGPGTYAIQWYSGSSASCSSGMTAVGANATTYSATFTATTNVCYAVTDGSYGSTPVFSAVDTVKVDNALVAGAVTPKSPGVDVGQSLMLSAPASSGTPTYSYQWYYGFYPTCSSSTSSPFAGQTNSTFTEVPGSTEYVCYSVTDSSLSPETVFSTGDLVTVNPSLQGGVPSPLSPTIDSGQSVILTAVPSGGTPPYTYQWFSGTSSTCSGDTTLGGTTKTVNVTPTANLYYCYQVHDSSLGTPAAGALSSTDEVNVNSGLMALPITPASPKIDLGQSVTLKSNPSGGTPVDTYQWYGGGSSTCASDSALVGSTGPDLRTAPRSNEYFCYAVSDGSTDPPTARSAADLVTVNPTISVGTVSPSAPTIDSGQSTTLSASPTGGTTPYTFQWYSGLSAACSSDTTALGTSQSQPVSPTTSTYYCFRVTDSSVTPETAESPTVKVTVEPTLVAGPVFTNSSVLDLGETALLIGNQSGGTPPYTYQWYLGYSTNCSNDSAIRRALYSVYIADPTKDTYYCYAVSDSSSGTPAVTSRSPTDLLTVAPAFSIGAVLPSAPTIHKGGYVVLSGSSTGGAPPVQYSWWASGSSTCTNGTAIPGADTLTYNATPTTTTYYCLLATDSSNGSPAGSYFSAPDLVTVIVPPAPTFLGLPVLQGVAALGILLGLIALIGWAVVVRSRRARRRQGSPGNFL